jgi:hypothetical protein
MILAESWRRSDVGQRSSMGCGTNTLARYHPIVPTYNNNDTLLELATLVLDNNRDRGSIQAVSSTVKKGDVRPFVYFFGPKKATITGSPLFPFNISSNLIQ